MNDEIKISEEARRAGIEINALVETYRDRALTSAEQIMRIVQRFSDDRVKELEPGLHAAMEWGFRACEKGMNLDMAREEFNTIRK